MSDFKPMRVPGVELLWPRLDKLYRFDRARQNIFLSCILCSFFYSFTRIHSRFYILKSNLIVCLNF